MSAPGRDQYQIVQIQGVSSVDDTTATNVHVDPITNRTLVDTGSSTTEPGLFTINDVEESGTTAYIGKENASGVWWITKIDESGSPTTMQHASIATDSDQTTYSLAWTNRATLTYGDYGVAF